MSRSKSTPKAKTRNPHLFSIKPISPLNLPTTVMVNFQPALVQGQNFSSNSRSTRKVSITPSFNRDRKHYTSCFINPFCFQEESQSAMLTSHENKVKESCIEISSTQILTPKPRKGSSCFCCVCRTHYEDYLEHITSLHHRKKIKEAPYSKLIAQLVQKMQPTPVGVLTRAAAKRMYKFNDTPIQEPRKKKIVEGEWFKKRGEDTEGKREQSTVPKSELIE